MKLKFYHFPGDPDLGWRRYNLGSDWKVLSFDFGTFTIYFRIKGQWKKEKLWALRD